MSIKLLYGVVLISIILGAVLAVRSGLENRRLLAEHRALAEQVGYLPISDPTKVHVVALETNDAHHFSWRIYEPPKFRARVATRGGSGTYSHSTSHDYLVNMRFRRNHDGLLQAFMDQGAGSSLRSLGNREFADLVYNRWDELEIEQLATDGVRRIENDEVVHLLRMRLSPTMQEAAREILSESQYEHFSEALLDIRYGAAGAFRD